MFKLTALNIILFLSLTPTFCSADSSILEIKRTALEVLEMSTLENIAVTTSVLPEDPETKDVMVVDEPLSLDELFVRGNLPKYSESSICSENRGKRIHFRVRLLPIKVSERIILKELVNSSKRVPGGLAHTYSSNHGSPTSIGEIAKFILACYSSKGCPLHTKPILENE